MLFPRLCPALPVKFLPLFIAKSNQSKLSSPAVACSVVRFTIRNMSSLPHLPSPHRDFVPYLARNPTSSVAELFGPYNEFQAKLREIYAQFRDDPLIQDPLVNAVPIFDGHEDNLRIRARSLDDEMENQKYIMPLTQRIESLLPSGGVRTIFPATIRSRFHMTKIHCKKNREASLHQRFCPSDAE